MVSKEQQNGYVPGNPPVQRNVVGLTKTFGNSRIIVAVTTEECGVAGLESNRYECQLNLIDGREVWSLSTLFPELLFRSPTADASTSSKSSQCRCAGPTRCARSALGWAVAPESRCSLC